MKTIAKGMDDAGMAGMDESRGAACYLDTSASTLADWRFKGKGPTFKRVGKRMVRYRKADHDDWMEAQA